MLGTKKVLSAMEMEEFLKKIEGKEAAHQRENENDAKVEGEEDVKVDRHKRPVVVTCQTTTTYSWCGKAIVFVSKEGITCEHIRYDRSSPAVAATALALIKHLFDAGDLRVYPVDEPDLPIDMVVKALESLAEFPF